MLRVAVLVAHEVLELEHHLHLARAHVAVHERGEGRERVLAADRALEVGELHERHGRVGVAEREPVLRDAGEARVHLAAAGDPAVLRAAAATARARHDRDHHKGNGREEHAAEQLQAPGAARFGLALALTLLALNPETALLIKATAHRSSRIGTLFKGKMSVYLGGATQARETERDRQIERPSKP